MYFMTSSFVPDCVLLLLFASFLFYLWMKYNYGYWKRRGIFSPQATFPIGHLGSVAVLRESIGVRMSNLYKQTKQQPCVGLFLLLKKVLLVNNLDLAKDILLKDHVHFQGRGFRVNKEEDPLGQHLFNLDGEEWKRIRAKLTPTFTSSKMKFMFETMLTCSTEKISFIDENRDLGGVIDMKEVLARFGTDVISSCAFGIQTNSFKYPETEFRNMGKKAFSASFSKIVIDVLSLLTPKLLLKLGIKRAYSDVTSFFLKTVQETIEYRERNTIARNDFLQLLIDMKNSNEKTGNHLTIPEITAQVYIFFLAGFETSSTASSYAFLELAENSEIQDRIRAQIDEALKENDGKIIYEMLTKMTYLTQIVNEAMRLYPPVPFIFRNCTKDYTIPGTKTVIEKGTLALVSVLGIHRDPDIYPDPLKFDPDKFSPEKSAIRHRFSHIPFGEGPRICIGSRFGVMQVKLAIFIILQHFEVSLCEKTILPVAFSPRTILLHFKGEMTLRLARRKCCNI